MNLLEATELYLAHRRAEGIAYKNQAGCLRSLCSRSENKDIDELRIEDLHSYLRADGLTHATVSKRFTLVAKFIQFHQDRGRATSFKMPLRPRHSPQVFTPHIYTSTEVRNILVASRGRAHGSIPTQTFEALILFLYATGSSLFSAMHLRDEDLDVERSNVTLENQRSNGKRTIPLNQQLVATLVEYASWKSSNSIEGGSFFVRADRSPLVKETVGSNFRSILKAARCVRRDGSHCRPRMHDFRATFAVQRISGWIRDGEDLGTMLPALAAYMGMIDLTVTERYLALSPERFRKELQKLSASTQSAV